MRDRRPSPSTHATPSPRSDGRPGRDPWWMDATIYQVYVRSFQDADGDGVGDLAGVTQRLDHLQWLGVGAIWLTPFYESPMEDFGYDITDHRAVDPAYGTLEDFDRLVEEAHARDIRVIVDYVPNHTSRHHEWFRSARASRDSPYRDWYIWADGREDGRPPNNWIGGSPNGSAWCWDEEAGQWYLAFFSPAQPELNWANPDVREAMLGVLDFWLSRGADGVRVDMVDFLGKDARLRDEPADLLEGSARDYLAKAAYHLDREQTLEYLRDFRAVARRHGNALLIGEVVYFLPLEDFGRFSQGGELLDLPANFRLTFLPFEREPLADWLGRYDRFCAEAGVWPNHCFANHDTPRPARDGEALARLRMLVLLTLRGTPFLYYGDELAMPQVRIPPERARDKVFVDPDSGESRDGARTPMAWSPEPGHGFTGGDVEPWLPFHDDAARRNVAAQREDERSMLALTRRLLALRRTSEALRRGTFGIAEAPASCLAYRRESADEALTVVVNLSDDAADLGTAFDGHTIVLTTRLDREEQPVDGPLLLQPHEGVLLRRPRG